MEDLPVLVDEIVGRGSLGVQLPAYPQYAVRIEHRRVRQEWGHFIWPFVGNRRAHDGTARSGKGWNPQRTGALEHLAPLILVSLSQADPVKPVWFSSEGLS